MQSHEEKEILSSYLERIRSIYGLSDDAFLEISTLLNFCYSHLVVTRKNPELDFERPEGESYCPLAIRLLKLLVEEFNATKSSFSIEKFAAAILICSEDRGQSILMQENNKNLSAEMTKSKKLARKLFATGSDLSNSEQELLLAYTLDRARHFHRSNPSEQDWLNFVKNIDLELVKINNQSSILYSKLKYWREHFAAKYYTSKKRKHSKTND